MKTRYQVGPLSVIWLCSSTGDDDPVFDDIYEARRYAIEMSRVCDEAYGLWTSDNDDLVAVFVIGVEFN